MSIFNLFSRRQAEIRGELPDVYQYEEIPQNFRVQVVQIIRDSIGGESPYNEPSNKVYSEINRILCKEYGVFSLVERPQSNFASIYDYFLQINDYEKCLDIIEITFKFINVHVRENSWNFNQISQVIQSPDDSIQELNSRFKQWGIGYQFESNELIRLDSQFLHSETVKPVLQLLDASKIYSGANSEFLRAHEHYRHKRYKECLVECLKSFESLMKSICTKHSWEFNQSDTAKKLINICLKKNLVPSYLQTQFSSIRALLESGIPTVRNKEGGHGQGTEITDIPEFLASYTLHLTATNLLFLAKCEENIS